jgi:hypothetical protein
MVNLASGKNIPSLLTVLIPKVLCECPNYNYLGMVLSGEKLQSATYADVMHSNSCSLLAPLCRGGEMPAVLSLTKKQ